MERRRMARPTLEAMEPRQLLATIALDGSGRGVERTVSMYGKTATIATSQHELSGGVRIGALGTFRVSGDLFGPATITLSNARGTLLFAESGMPAAAEDHFSFVVGTGAYSGDQVEGELTMTFGRGHTSTSDTTSAVTTTTLEPVSIRITQPMG